MTRELRHTKGFRSRALGTRALGTLLLALPLSGIAFQLSPAQAQPTPPTSPKKKFKPLSAEQKAAVTEAMVISQATQVGKSVVDLKMDGASLDQVIARVKGLLPDSPLPVEVRGARPVKVSFDLKQAQVGTVLGNVACLAGCRLWVVSTGFLIAPRSQLTEAERADMNEGQVGEWLANRDAGDPDGGNNGWSARSTRDRLLARTVAQEVTGGTDPAALPVVNMKMAFGDFSPGSQGMLQQLVDSSRGLVRSGGSMISPVHLTPSSPISIDTSKPGWITIQYGDTLSDSHAGAGSIGLLIQ